jgi:anti-sigma regulatory factor (Ser/Thr protein kinase)
VSACSPTEAPGAATAPALRLRVEADAAGVGAASAWIRALAEGLGFGADDVYRLDLCLSEVVTNVVDHSGVGACAGPIGLEAEVAADGSSIAVTVVDDGAAFDPLSAPPPPGFTDPADIEIGGLGIALVRACADACRYERIAGQNVFSFRIDRGGAGAGAGAA